MAANNSASQLALQIQKHFDQLALMWDEEIASEACERLGKIVDELDIHPGYRVLDIGGGTGILLPFLLPKLNGRGKIIALDFSNAMLCRAKAKKFPPIVEFVRADVLSLPLMPDSADLAICNNAFAHFINKALALKEIARVLKNKGRLVICHTMSRDKVNQLHQSLGSPIANHLLPTRSQLEKLIKGAGLKLIRYEDVLERYVVIAEKHDSPCQKIDETFFDSAIEIAIMACLNNKIRR